MALVSIVILKWQYRSALVGTNFSDAEDMSSQYGHPEMDTSVTAEQSELYPKLRHRNKNGRCSVGTFIKFVWATMGRKFLNGNISAMKEDIEL